MRILPFIAAALLAGAAAIGLAHAQSTNLAPNATVTTTTSATPSALIIGTNPSRRQIRICNVGTTVIWIWPGPVTPTVSAYELPALSSGTTTCFTPPDAVAGPQGVGEGQQWSMESVAGGGSASVFEW
jgi:hypothetical protein